ncbi:3463_t:CDS:2 [Funneliformis caledonium]|uniref:3463_t:CDS:1 n=1 Tax=Funneliformis caledonium TaxID=1117310 RepID=A0A9N9BT53_9GLOM|nr:3463_t:CDS:2 [Funneliformis caledonium]
MSSSDQIPASSNDDSFGHHNKLHFNSEAKKYDIDPLALTISKKCGEAIIKELRSELDPEKTEVMDFACGTGLISQALSPYVKSIIGVDSSQNMVDEYNKKIWQQGIDASEMKAICLDLKESEGDQLDGRKFDLVVVDPETIGHFNRLGDKHKHVEHTVAHKGGFYHNEIEEVFLNTGVLDDVKVELSFTFNQFIEKDQKECTFKYLIAKGRKKE